ncbi:acetylxylan esterase [Planctomicrobium sp. SH664]|uniref:acetylxylan esterase n=1 Tax=Planctomicrobium sp. SH664 TaxID=3448125 RepID=UPI003F5BC7C9
MPIPRTVPLLTQMALLLAITPSLLQAQVKTAAEPTVKLTITADRPHAQYHIGETATFSIVATQDGKPLENGQVKCVASNDSWAPQPPQTVEIRQGRGTFSGKIDEPGFLSVNANIGKASAIATAAFDPLQIQPSLPVPDDFERFWARQQEELAKVPMEVKLTPKKAPEKEIDAFDVQISCLGAPVSGYFGRPQNAKPKSLPAILFVHGAGVRSSILAKTAWAAEEGGMLALDINAHGIPNGQPADYYQKLADGELRDYRREGANDPEKFYFKGMFLRMLRAIDFLTAQPEWDGKTLIVFGSSQGGFQAFAAAGIDPRVTMICAGVPAGCDHSGNLVNRVSGWPKLLARGENGKPDEAQLKTARYFDCVNFAAKAKCEEAAVTVGYIDRTCPPTSVYAAYNALKIPKQIHFDVDAGHTNTPAAMKFMEAAARAHVQRKKAEGTAN